MRFRLDLTLRPAEGALLRVLGTAERRGYTPLAIEGQRSGDDASWHLQLTLSGERPPEGLCRQMEKLYDCLKVEVAECP
ncbi:MAG: acetolactate synthase [Aquimonas sp.]|nr:acetolactate synthase [Aquimonas sp.]